MQLLVSVKNAAEARAALLGGADIIDAKDPAAGALGAVTLDVMRGIRRVIPPERLVSAALGDASDEAEVERDARGFTEAGASFVKIGFAGISSQTRVAKLLQCAARASSRVVAVAYADAVDTILPSGLLDQVAAAGAYGVLLDTADKRGPGLRDLIDARALAAWVSDVHSRGLIVAVAGKLGVHDLAFVYDAGADIAGVRGAACDGERNGIVSTHEVRRLRAHLDSLVRVSVPNPAPRSPFPV